MKNRKTLRFRPVTPFVMAALVVGFGACGFGVSSQQDSTEVVQECAEYDAAYRACAAKVGGLAMQVTARHVQSSRAAFRVQTNDAASREKLKASCTAAARQIAEACR